MVRVRYACEVPSVRPWDVQPTSGAVVRPGTATPREHEPAVGWGPRTRGTWAVFYVAPGQKIRTASGNYTDRAEALAEARRKNQELGPPGPAPFAFYCVLDAKRSAPSKHDRETPCRHCGKRVGACPTKGLCFKCRRTPAVNAMYESQSKYGRRDGA